MKHETKQEVKQKPVFALSCGRELNKKEFCDYFERKVMRTIRKFRLISKNDKIAVACSGGKDSITVLYILNKFCTKRRQQIEAIAIDEGIKGYRDKLLKDLKKFCTKEKIKLNVFSFKREYSFTLDGILKKIEKLRITNCYVCSILKRWLLNKKVKKLGFNVIATGHSLDDEAETILLNQLKGNPLLLAKLGPVTGIIKNKEFVQRIKPLYLCSEHEIILYAKLKKLPLPLTICPLRGKTFRVDVRNFLNKLEKSRHEIKNAIVNSFLQYLPLLKEKYEKATLKKCAVCHEPSSQEICKSCQLLKALKLSKI